MEALTSKSFGKIRIQCELHIDDGKNIDHTKQEEQMSKRNEKKKQEKGIHFYLY
jgi:hypothetical protein